MRAFSQAASEANNESKFLGWNGLINVEQS